MSGWRISAAIRSPGGHGGERSSFGGCLVLVKEFPVGGIFMWGCLYYIMGESSMTFPRENVTVWMATILLRSKGGNTSQEHGCYHILLQLLLLLLRIKNGVKATLMGGWVYGFS